MKPELWYSVVVRDRNGKVISQERRRSRSFLKAWNQVVCAQMYPFNTSVSSTLITITGESRWPFAASENFRMNGPAGNTNYGIVVGTGSTPVTVTDYALDALIPQGLGAGQMDYLACSVADASVSDPHCSFVVSRSATNNSGGSITVRETGIYMIAQRLSPTTNYYCCGARDVLGTPQEVPDGGSITVNYTLRVSE